MFQNKVVVITGGAGVLCREFAKEGYTYKVMNDKGDIIDSLTVEKPCAVTIIYFKN